MDKERIKNKSIDLFRQLKRKPSISIYVFITIVVLCYASIYTYQTYFTGEESSISETDRNKEIILSNNTFQMVENEYNPESEFYIGKFVIKDLNQQNPISPEDNLNVEVIMEGDTSHELNVAVEQITPTFFIVTINNLPNDYLALRYDFTFEDSNTDDENSETFEDNLYTNVTEDEEDAQLSYEDELHYQHESYQFEIETVNEDIAQMESQIEEYNEEIEMINEQITENEASMQTLTSEEQTEMNGTIESNKSTIQTYEEQIAETESDINERQEKLQILEDLLDDSREDEDT